MPSRSPLRRPHPRARRRSRAGFILLFGTRSIVSDDRTAPAVQAVCPRCGQRAHIVGKSYRTWFTVFFIPIFPVSGLQRFSQCTNCGGQFQVEARELGAQVAAADREQSQRAIGLYNSLRNSPGNSITLNELMVLYATMNEFDSAIAAARDFPAALENSEQCITTLGRVHLAKHNHPEAVRLFDQAVARNPNLGEAHYYRAVAFLTSATPDFAQAAASARMARNTGYPGAEQLLHDAGERLRGGAGR